MENPRSDIKADGMMYNAKVKSSNVGSESNTMDSFQDGGQQNMNLDRSQSDYVPPMDGPRVNSELNNYPHDSEEQSSGRTEYGKMNDNIPTSQFNSGFHRGNFGMGDQHGGLSSSGGGEFPQQNSNFSQYGQHNMRTGYPQSSRQGPMPSRGGMAGGGMGMIPPNFNSGQQRMMSGPSIQQQQSGPTPTLNQLLQNASSQRYYGGYGEHGTGQQKGMNDVANSPSYNQAGNWGQHARPSGGGVGYPQMPGNQPFRSQMYDGTGPGGRRPPSYPPGPGSGGGGSSGTYGGPQQYSPNSHHTYPPMSSSQPSRMPSQPYPSQQQQQQPSSGQPPNSSSPMPYPGGCQSPFMGQSQSGGQQQNANNSSSQAQNSPSQPYASPIGSNHGASPSPRPQPSPSPQNSDKTQHNSNSQDGLTSDESNSGEVNSINNSNHSSAAGGNNSGVTTPTSSGQGTGGGGAGQGVPHPAVSALRPIPSPAGSSGSRSNTPASVSGNQAGSPMPPRPPSAHMEGPNRIQSPMANQGYMPPMMPPPGGMSSNQMGGGGYPNKSSSGPGPHPGMMGPGGPNASAPSPAGMPPSHMQHNSQYPNQPGQYANRGPGGMGGYGGQNSYGSPGPMGQMYPNNMNPMGRSAPGVYPNSYPQSGPMNSHYNNFNNQPSMGPGPTLPSSMPQQPQHPMNNVPPNQQSPGPKGAQAAAQAAMIAAANSAANRSLFARQQLESQGQGNPPGPGSGMASQPPNSQGQIMPPGKGFGHFGSPGLSMNQYGPPGQVGHENVNRMSPGQGPPSSSSSYGDMMGGGMGSQNIGPASPQPSTILGSQGNSQGRSTPHDSNSNDAPTPEPKTPLSGTEGTQPSNAATPVSSADMPPPSSTPSMQPTDSNSNHHRPPIDENSMSSTCSDDTQPARGKDLSHPATPIAASPSASQSSIHDDDNMSSPSWPGTPSSHTQLQQKHDGAMRLYDMGEEPERRPFLDRLFSYMEEKGTPITAMPMISKQPIDLYKLYVLVKERGGLLEVTKTKKWREISTAINVGSSGSAGFTLRKNYIKHLFPFECKFDNGGMDPTPVLAQIEAMTQKKEPKRPASANANQVQNSNNGPPPPPDTYQGRPQPPGYEGYPGQRMPGMAGEMHGPAMMPPPPNQGMMHNNMPPHYEGSMMNQSNMPPNTSVMPNNGMMPNNRGMMPNNSMMPGGSMANTMSGGQMMPNRPPPPNMMTNNGEGMNNQNFPEQGQGMGPPGQHYGRGYNASGNMQGGNMPNSYPPYNRSGNMPPYQQGQPPQGSYPEGMNRPSRPGSSNDQYPNDPYRRNSNSMMPGQQGPPPPTSTSQGQEGFNSQSSSYPNQQTSSSSQYPSYPGPPSQERSQPGLADKLLQKLLSKKFDQQAPSPSSQPSSQPPSSSSPMLQTSSQGPDAPSSTSSTGYSGPAGGPPRPYPNQQPMMSNRPPVHGPPDSNYPGPNSSGQQPYPRPAGFGSQGQDGNFNQSNYPTPNHPQSQQPIYGQKPGQPIPAFQGQKQYPGYQRDGYNVPPGYPNSQTGQQYGYNQPRPNIPPDSMQPDMRSSTRGADGSWSGMGQRTIPPGAPATGPPSSSSLTGFTPNSSSSGPSMPPSTTSVPLYGVYNRPNRMSPMKQELLGKPFTPQKMTKQSHGNSYPAKKEIVFPPDSVEAVNPLLQKRKKLNSKDVAPVDPWKLMMALKSGLLAQSTWALDTLSIMLYDDNAVLYFNLAHLPGLLDALLSHWRHYLIEMFSKEFEDMELCSKEASEQQSAKRFKSLKEEFEEVVGCKIEATVPDAVDMPNNYTYKTRQGIPVKVVEDECDTVYDTKSWDVHEGVESSATDWKMGRGDTSFHVISQFQKSDTLDFLRRSFYGPERYDIKNSECQKVSNDAAETSEKSDEQLEGDAVEPVAESEVKTETEVLPIAEQEIKKEPEESKPNSSVEECEEKMDTSSDKENIDHNVEITPNGPIVTKEEKPDSPMPICAKDNSLTSCFKNDVEGRNKEPYIEPDDNAQDATEVSASSASRNCVSQESKTEKPVKIETGNFSCENSKDSGSVKPDDDREEEEFSLPQINHEERRQKFLAALENNKETAQIIEQVKRKFENSSEESEAYHRDPPPLYLISSSQEELGQRCVCVSNIIRSLSFVPGNDRMMSADRGLLRIISKLLLLHHTHPKRRKDNKTFDREEDANADDSLDDGREDWWWSTLHALRENALVILANIAGQLNLTQVPEEIVFPLLDSLLHWAVCPSSCAHDPLPSMSANSVLSPQRLVLETMCKLCVTDGNVDLLLATPPFSRTMHLFSRLINLLANRKEQVLREFSIVLLSSLVQGDSAAARTVALQHPSISLLLDFIETAEHQAMQIAQSHGVDMLKDNPEMMGTSLGMLRRAAVALQQMAVVPDNRPLFLKQQDRLLTLVMSHVLDQTVTSVLADVLYLCSQDPIFS